MAIKGLNLEYITCFHVYGHSSNTCAHFLQKWVVFPIMEGPRAPLGSTPGPGLKEKKIWRSNKSFTDTSLHQLQTRMTSTIYVAKGDPTNEQQLHSRSTLPREMGLCNGTGSCKSSHTSLYYIFSISQKTKTKPKIIFYRWDSSDLFLLLLLFFLFLSKKMSFC